MRDLHPVEERRGLVVEPRILLTSGPPQSDERPHALLVDRPGEKVCPTPGRRAGTSGEGGLTKINNNGATCEEIASVAGGTRCGHSTTFTPCVGQPTGYSNFRGEWRLVATQATPTFQLTMTSESGASSTETTTWQTGLEAAAEIGFLSTKVSASTSSTYEQSVKMVLGESAKVTCNVPANCTGNTWAYYVTGTETATGAALGVPTNCLLQCNASNNPSTPKCPPSE